MHYTCLQDIFDEIYEADYGEWAIGRKYEVSWREGFQKFATKEGLLEALSYYFKIWDEGERGIAWQEERRGYKEYERAAWCFYFAFNATSIPKDPSIIPHLLQYVLTSEKEYYVPWKMPDSWRAMMLVMLVDYYGYGISYMPWTMKSLHLFRHDLDALNWFIFQMVNHTFEEITPEEIPELAIIDALPLANRDVLNKSLNYRLQIAREVFDRHQTKVLEPRLSARKLKNALKYLESAKETLYCTEYILGQLLALPENVVSLHAAD